MCVKTQLKTVFHPIEQLKYWFVGIPLVLLIAAALSFPVGRIYHVIHDTATASVVESTLQNN